MKQIIEYCSKRETEAGGVIKAGFFTPLENIADDPVDNFEFEIDDWGEVEAIVHSHPNSNQFLSPLDRKMQVNTGVDWWIVRGDDIHKYKPVPLLRGREFEYGHSDCGTLIEDAYHLMGIDLGRAERIDLDQDAENGVVIKRLEKIGFYRARELQAGDVIVTSSQAEGNHLMLFIDEDNVLHHAFNQLSKRIAYSYLIERRTHSIWRHKDFKALMIQAVINDMRASDL